MPNAPDHTGRLVARRYRLGAVIGEGGFGRVYRAEDERLGTQVAVKIIFPWWAQDAQWIERFVQEAKTAAKIGHPGVVRVTDTGTDPDVGPYTVAELINGSSVRELLDCDGSMPTNHAVELVAQAAEALGAAHDQGIVHRDVKPSNLLLGADGRLRVCDFGIARLQTGATKSSASHTLVGTPAYMAPEQAKGKATGPAADQYALAVVLFELISGKPPFGGDTPVAVALAHIAEEPPEPPPTTPRTVSAALARALAKSPDSRFADIRDFAGALRDDFPTQPLAVSTPTGPTRRVPRSPRSRPEPATAVVPKRRRRSAIAGAALLTLLLGGATAAALLARDGDGERTTADSTQPLPTSRATDSPSAPTPPVVRVTVPVLTGLSANGARARVENHSLSIEIKRANSRRVPAGVVARQRPAPGTKVAEKSAVRITVSNGPPPVELPELAGSGVSAVRAQLASLGLRYTTQEVASSRPAGTVVRTTPTAGEIMRVGDTVNLSIARAKRWRSVGTYELTADGSTPSFRISGSQWRITYTLSGCGYVCPFLEIKGETYEQVDLAEGTHTTYGPEGSGSYSLESNSVGSQPYDLRLVVEQFS